MPLETDISRFFCSNCVEHSPASPKHWKCRRCGAPYDLDAAPSLEDVPTGDRERQSGVWRYRRALPVTAEVSLGEPETPLVSVEWSGLAPLAKLESLLPTGSFKDRGSAVLMSWLVDRGIERVVADSSGNLGASVAAYAARAGLECRVFVPADASDAKLAQIRAYGASVIPVPGSRADVAKAAQASLDGSSAYASHAWSPIFLAGTQTFSFEVFEQLGCSGPAALVFPVGAGTLFLGAFRGFAALKAAGYIHSSPRFFGVQVAACAPLAQAFSMGSSEPIPVEKVVSSAAEGILTSVPPRGREILRAARETGGAIVEISEGSLSGASRSLAHQGIYAEPTSAAAFAGLDVLLASGLVTPGETIVVPVTGHGLKGRRPQDISVGLGAQDPE